MRTLLAALLAATACGLACSSTDAPTKPVSAPDPASLIPVAPAPQPTPTPTPGALPDDGDALPAPPGGGSSSCGAPNPPAVSRVNVKVHSQQADRAVLDATPLVGPDAAYCRAIGFTDGRSFCPVRTEGDSERQACETARVGRASDTGRFGPTWSANGRPCEGRGAGASCLNHPDNQYLAFAYGQGTFRACTASGVCGSLEVR